MRILIVLCLEKYEMEFGDTGETATYWYPLVDRCGIGLRLMNSLVQYEVVYIIVLAHYDYFLWAWDNLWSIKGNGATKGWISGLE